VRAFPRSSRAPRSLGVRPPSRHEPAGEHLMGRRTVRRSPVVHSYRGPRMLLDIVVGLLGRWQARSSPIKRSTPFSSRPCPGLSRRRTELRVRLAVPPSKLSPTFLGTHSSPQTSPKSPAQPHLAGTPAAAAPAPDRRHTRLAGPFPPQVSTKLDP
jgi:hypothetical protein